MAISLPTGDMDSVKKRLMALIELAEPATHTFGEWNIAQDHLYNPRTGNKLPVATVRLAPVTIIDPVYSRLIPESGDMGLYSFSIHVFASACTTAGEEKYKHAHELADRVIKYMKSRDWNSAPHSSYPIVDVEEISARESEPSQQRREGMRKICRIIIEGVMLVKRSD